MELSTDGGATWTDIGTGAYNGATNAVTASPLGTNQPAFVNRMVGWPNFANVVLNLGDAYANQDVKIRFRIGADESTGAPGWDIDNISVSGITDTPFTALVPEPTVCTGPIILPAKKGLRVCGAPPRPASFIQGAPGWMDQGRALRRRPRKRMHSAFGSRGGP